jgi:hypothetical protein
MRTFSLKSIVIRGDQSPSLPELCSSQRADPSISVIGFAPEKVVLDYDFLTRGSPKGIVPGVTFSANG